MSDLFDELFDELAEQQAIDAKADVPTLHECIVFLSERCDGAHALDGQGFNKLDADRGKRLANRPYERWSDLDRGWAYKRLRKYHRQFEAEGIRADLVPEPELQGEHVPVRELLLIEDRAFGIKWEGLPRHEFETVHFAANQIPGIAWIYQGNVRGSVPFDSVAAHALREFARAHEFEWDQSVEDKFFELIDRAALVFELSEAVDAPDYDLGPAELVAKDGKTPWGHQRAGVKYLEMVGWKAIIADQPGTGKTATALLSAVKANAFPLLVVCPASVKRGWEQQANNWLPGKSVRVLQGGGLQPIGGDIVIANYDILRWAGGQPGPLLALLMQRQWGGVVVDECHYAKSYEASRTLALRKLYESQGILLKLHMSGTPVMNSVNEFLPNLEMVGLLQHFGAKAAFTRRYCAKHPRLTELNQKLRESGYLCRLKEDHVITPEGKLVPLREVPDSVLSPEYVEWYEQYRDHHYAIEHITYSLRQRGYDFKAGALKLPEKIISPILMDLEDPARYEKAHLDTVRWLEQMAAEYGDPDGGTGRLLRWQRALILIRINKLRQEVARQKYSSARQWIEGFLAETSEKLVVVTWHQDVAKRLERYFSGAATIWGGQTLGEREENRKKFAHDPDCKLLIMQIMSGGFGIDELQTHCSNIAFLELGWNPATHVQAEDRLHRGGQTKQVTAHYLLATPTARVPNTIDHYLIQIIDAKRGHTTAAMHGGEVADEELIGVLIDKMMQEAV